MESIRSIDISEVSMAHGNYFVEDTGWTVSVSRNGIDETAKKRGKWSAEYHSLTSINDMLTNAILLDTICVNKPSKRLGNSAAFVHHMYCPISIDGVHAIAKLYVTEEVGNINKFYLTKIEMVPTDSRVLGKNAFAPNSSVDTKISIADIYNFVKSNNDEYEADSDEPTSFNSKPVNPAMLNEDKTPKVVYHGTDEEFTVFDITKSRSYKEKSAPQQNRKGTRLFRLEML